MMYNLNFYDAFLENKIFSVTIYFNIESYSYVIQSILVITMTELINIFRV